MMDERKAQRDAKRNTAWHQEQVNAADEAVRRNRELLRLEDDCGADVDLYHLFRSLLVWADDRGISFDAELHHAREDHAADF